MTLRESGTYSIGKKKMRTVNSIASAKRKEELNQENMNINEQYKGRAKTDKIVQLFDKKLSKNMQNAFSRLN
jgi:hypothetical protein